MAGAEVEHGGGFPDAALGGGGEVVEEEAGRMAGFEHLERGPGAVKDDGHFIVDIVRGSGCNGAGAVGASKTFHNSSFAGGSGALVV